MFTIVAAILLAVTVTCGGGIARPDDQVDSTYVEEELEFSGPDSAPKRRDLVGSSYNRFGSPKNKDDRLREKLCENVLADQIYDSRYTRYDFETKKCYLATGETGPCRNNLVFHSERNNTIYGQCDCDTSRNDRTLIYHPRTRKCHFIFQKAFCREGRWLTLDPANGHPKCERNPCAREKRNSFGRIDTQENSELVFVDGKCVRLGSKCGETDQNGIERIIGFSEGRLLPHCKSNLPRPAYAIAAIVLTCAPGTFLSISGNCQASWVW